MNFLFYICQRRKFLCQIETLKREIEQSLFDRDKAIREAHELRYEGNFELFFFLKKHVGKCFFFF